MIDAAAHEESARRYVKNFQYKYGREILHLAFHAALPVVINADFVHLLRINFFLESSESLPFTSEADLLLSSLCYDIGDGLYEIAPHIRNILLQRLVKEYSQERAREVATLLWQYNEYYTPWRDRTELERAQQLTALNFLDPLRAKQWLEEAEVSPGMSSSVEREWFVAMWKEIERIPEIFTFSSQVDLPDRDMREFKLPELKLLDLGVIHEAEIRRWLIKSGDTINLDQPMVEVETDEVIIEIPSPITGRVSEIRVKSGQTVKIDDVLVVFDISDIVEKLKFGELLRQFRIRAKMTQQALADQLGIHRRTISAWEYSDSPPKNRTVVVELARVLHLNEQETSKLLNLDGNREDSINISAIGTFSDLLREFRKRQGITQAVLGKKLNVHRNSVAAWERGDRLPQTRESILEIAKALNLSLEDATELLRGALFSPVDAATYTVYSTIADEANEKKPPLADSNTDSKSSEVQEAPLVKDKSDADLVHINDINQPKQELIGSIWSSQDEGLIIDDMLTNRESPYWEQCQAYVSQLVKRQAVNLPIDYYEDITQNAMIKISHSLQHFRRESKLTSWIAVIVKNCIADTYKKAFKDSTIQIPTPDDTFDDSEDQLDNPNYLSSEFVLSLSNEASAITREELQEITSALEEYINAHSKKERNSAILRLVLFEGKSIESVGNQLGVSAPVVGYVVRSARAFARQRLGR